MERIHQTLAMFLSLRTLEKWRLFQSSRLTSLIEKDLSTNLNLSQEFTKTKVRSLKQWGMMSQSNGLLAKPKKESIWHLITWALFSGTFQHMNSMSRGNTKLSHATSMPTLSLSLSLSRRKKMLMSLKFRHRKSQLQFKLRKLRRRLRHQSRSTITDLGRTSHSCMVLMIWRSLIKPITKLEILSHLSIPGLKILLLPNSLQLL